MKNLQKKRQFEKKISKKFINKKKKKYLILKF